MIHIPAVRLAIAVILRKLDIVKIEQPSLTPRQQELEARRRCADAILAANAAINRAEMATLRRK